MSWTRILNFTTTKCQTPIIVLKKLLVVYTELRGKKRWVYKVILCGYDKYICLPHKIFADLFICFLLLPLVVRTNDYQKCTVDHFILFFSFTLVHCLYVASYGRVYTTDPYHALAPAAAAYGVGAMVRTKTQALQSIQHQSFMCFKMHSSLFEREMYMHIVMLNSCLLWTCPKRQNGKI